MASRTLAILTSVVLNRSSKLLALEALGYWGETVALAEDARVRELGFSFVKFYVSFCGRLLTENNRLMRFLFSFYSMTLFTCSRWAFKTAT